MRLVQAGEDQRAVHRDHAHQQRLRIAGGAPLGLDQARQLPPLGGGQADPGAQPERLADRLAEEPAGGEPGDPADDLTDQEAEDVPVS
ncbi:hypothetical protein MTP02_30400 [Streptomyces albus]|nr:hypothetical protein MTP02_30400 [Streptomyces albus]